TPARASRPRSCPSCSSASARRIRRARASTAAWAWVWPSCGTWWSCTAARSRCRARATAAARRSGSRCRSPPGVPQLWRLERELQGKKVLLVDAPSRAHDALTFALGQAGAAVQEEPSSVVGLEQIDHSLFDVVIAEVSPSLDGSLALMKGLRARPA